MQDKEKLDRVVRITTVRKSNGAVGSTRKGNSGKKGIIYQVDAMGVRTELAKANEGTFKALSKELRKTGYIPNYVTLNSNGETSF